MSAISLTHLQRLEAESIHLMQEVVAEAERLYDFLKPEDLDAAKRAVKDTDLSGLLYEKFEAHRKLMRYEQRAFNQLRNKSSVKKSQNEAKGVFRGL